MPENWNFYGNLGNFFENFSSVLGAPPPDPLRLEAPYKPSPGRHRFPLKTFIRAQQHYIKYPLNLQVLSGDINTGDEKIVQLFEKMIHFQRLILFKILNSVLIQGRFPFRSITKFSPEKLENVSKTFFKTF